MLAEPSLSLRLYEEAQLWVLSFELRNTLKPELRLINLNDMKCCCIIYSIRKKIANRISNSNNKTLDCQFQNYFFTTEKKSNSKEKWNLKVFFFHLFLTQTSFEYISSFKKHFYFMLSHSLLASWCQSGCYKIILKMLKSEGLKIATHFFCSRGQSYKRDLG